MKWSTDVVAWSVMCPAEMRKELPDTTQKFDFGGPVPPHWIPTLLWLPLVGRYINTVLNGFAMVTTYKIVSDFIADDLALGLDSSIIGMKISPRPVPPP
jgi:hypothetical protein